MKLAVFGLAFSSSWGNGHATLWRGLISALTSRGHKVCFFEKDVPYYASHRDMFDLPGGELILYRDWESEQGRARDRIREADAVIVTSFCPDALNALDLLVELDHPLRIFYEMDTGVTLGRLERGEDVAYVDHRGLSEYHLVLSYTGGNVLKELRHRLGAARVAPLYGSVDFSVHRPVQPAPEWSSDLSYLGTYAPDRQAALEELFFEPARMLPRMTFRVGGSLYPAHLSWPENVTVNDHVPPFLHATFYCSSRFTLNVTRPDMARSGYCPSGRLFEAAAAGVPLLSDYWEGIETFFEPEREILLCARAEDAVSALGIPEERRQKLSAAARRRTLACHTADRRAAELEALIDRARRRRIVPATTEDSPEVPEICGA